jgi:hypothetical protein
MSDNDEIIDSLHDKLVKAFIDYSIANERFEVYGYIKSQVAARQALMEIHRLSKDRRQELRKQKLEKHGNKRKGIEPTNPSEFRQRKINKANQKQQAGDDTDTN